MSIITFRDLRHMRCIHFLPRVRIIWFPDSPEIFVSYRSFSVSWSIAAMFAVSISRTRTQAYSYLCDLRTNEPLVWKHEYRIMYDSGSLVKMCISSVMGRCISYLCDSLRVKVLNLRDCDWLRNTTPFLLSIPQPESPW